MPTEQQLGATWVARHRWRNVVMTIVMWAGVLTCLICLVLCPVEALREKHPAAGVFVYLAWVAAALSWTCYRAWHYWLRCDDHGVTVVGPMTAVR
jgi:hypothetical protein